MVLRDARNDDTDKSHVMTRKLIPIGILQYNSTTFYPSAVIFYSFPIGKNYQKHDDDKFCLLLTEPIP